MLIELIPNIRKPFVVLLFIISGLTHADAKESLPWPGDFGTGIWNDEYKEFMAPDTLSPGQMMQVQRPVNANGLQSVNLAQNDTNHVVLKKLLATFKFKKNIASKDSIRISHVIDSIYKNTKTDPSSASGTAATPDYATMVHIIDSILKANENNAGKVIIDTPVSKTPGNSSKEIKPGGSGNFISHYGWMILAAVVIITGLAFFLWKRKKREADAAKIFFSYAWDQDEALISQLYNSLKRDGFNVFKDRENVGYKGVISKFMNEIGSADFVIVAISDKYLRSKFCMYELYEIFRNSGMNREAFGKKIFPIRIDESLNLGDPDIVNGYVKYWKQQEQEWSKRVKEESDSITEEQARQYQFIKRLVIEVSNMLSCLSDINALNNTLLMTNDFADIKSTLRAAIDAQH